MLPLLTAMADDPTNPGWDFDPARVTADLLRKPTLSTKDVALAVNRSPKTIRDWCRHGQLPGAWRYPNGDWAVPQAAFRQLLEHGPAPAADPNMLGSEPGPPGKVYSTYTFRASGADDDPKGRRRERHIRHEDAEAAGRDPGSPEPPGADHRIPGAHDDRR